jgi:ATP-binding cassette subfamily F protein uup
MQIAYFNQDRSELDPDLTVLRSICPYGETVEFLGRKIHVRSYLDRFLFSGARVDMQISKLSGGEQARLLLAKLMLIPANLLILDEPTNDLDFQTLGVLEECLEEFPGAVILVSHDRAFLSNVCDQILAFPEMEMYSDLGQWERSFRARTQSLQTARGGQSQSGSSQFGTSQSSGSSHKSKKKLSYKDQVEYDQMESNLSKLETALNRLTEKSADPKLSSNATELNKVLTELAEKHTQIENLYSRWAELEAKLQ